MIIRVPSGSSVLREVAHVTQWRVQRYGVAMWSLYSGHYEVISLCTCVASLPGTSAYAQRNEFAG